jgi:hypothetical protein
MHKQNHLGQSGMVSIVITMIMMLVISLIVIGVAQVTRHNQQEALDRQLSSQAFYAAESGVNDAVNYLQANLASLSSLPASTIINWKTTCDSFATDPSVNLDSQLSDGVSYTCLKVDPTPPQLTETPAAVNQTTVWPLISASGSWRNFTITWSDHGADRDNPAKNQACPTAGKFPKIGGWKCNYGVLRLDLVNAKSISPTTVADSSLVSTYYLSPLTSGGVTAADYGYGGSNIAGVKCSAGSCSFTIDKLNVKGPASDVYYARLTMLYEDSDSVTITGTLLDGTTGKFKNGQAVIDSTGRAQDVLRRIQVRVPLTGSATDSPLPTNALQSTSALCKYFTIVPGEDADYTADSSPSCNYGI